MFHKNVKIDVLTSFSDSYKKAKINRITPTAVDVIRSSYCIHGSCDDEIIFVVLYVSLNDGPYTLL